MKQKRPINNLPVGRYYYCANCETIHGSQKPDDADICQRCGQPWGKHKGVVIRGKFTQKTQPDEEALLFVVDARTVPVVIFVD